ARLRQSQALVNALEDDGEALAIAGDLNTWSLGWLERAIPPLRGASTDTPPPVREITYVHGRMRRRLDYMFFRLPDDWSARYERIGRMYGSDHYPLLGFIRFAPAGGVRVSARASTGE